MLLDQGTVPVDVAPPPPKRQRAGKSWDEVRAKLAEDWAELDGDGVEWVRLLDLFTAISDQKATNNAGAKIETYKKVLGFEDGVHYVQRDHPVRARGRTPFWISSDAAKSVWAYEVVGRSARVV